MNENLPKYHLALHRNNSLNTWIFNLRKIFPSTLKYYCILYIIRLFPLFLISNCILETTQLGSNIIDPLYKTLLKLCFLRSSFYRSSITYTSISIIILIWLMFICISFYFSVKFNFKHSNILSHFLVYAVLFVVTLSQLISEILILSVFVVYTAISSSNIKQTYIDIFQKFNFDIPLNSYALLSINIVSLALLYLINHYFLWIISNDIIYKNVVKYNVGKLYSNNKDIEISKNISSFGLNIKVSTLFIHLANISYNLQGVLLLSFFFEESTQTIIKLTWAIIIILIQLCFFIDYLKQNWESSFIIVALITGSNIIATISIIEIWWYIVGNTSYYTNINYLFTKYISGIIIGTFMTAYISKYWSKKRSEYLLNKLINDKEVLNYQETIQLIERFSLNISSQIDIDNWILHNSTCVKERCPCQDGYKKYLENRWHDWLLSWLEHKIFKNNKYNKWLITKKTTLWIQIKYHYLITRNFTKVLSLIQHFLISFENNTTTKTKYEWYEIGKLMTLFLTERDTYFVKRKLTKFLLEQQAYSNIIRSADEMWSHLIRINNSRQVKKMNKKINFTSAELKNWITKYNKSLQLLNENVSVIYNKLNLNRIQNVEVRYIIVWIQNLTKEKIFKESVEISFDNILKSAKNNKSFIILRRNPLDSTFVIKYISWELVEQLKYEIKNVLDRNMTILLPNELENPHDKVIHNYLFNSKHVSSEKKRKSYIPNNEGFLEKYLMNIAVLPKYEDIDVIIDLVKLPGWKQKCEMICDQDFIMINSNETFFKKIGMNKEMTRNVEINWAKIFGVDYQKGVKMYKSNNTKGLLYINQLLENLVEVNNVREAIWDLKSGLVKDKKWKIKVKERHLSSYNYYILTLTCESKEEKTSNNDIKNNDVSWNSINNNWITSPGSVNDVNNNILMYHNNGTSDLVNSNLNDSTRLLLENNVSPQYQWNHRNSVKPVQKLTHKEELKLANMRFYHRLFSIPFTFIYITTSLVFVVLIAYNFIHQDIYSAYTLNWFHVINNIISVNSDILFIALSIFRICFLNNDIQNDSEFYEEIIERFDRENAQWLSDYFLSFNYINDLFKYPEAQVVYNEFLKEEVFMTLTEDWEHNEHISTFTEEVYFWRINLHNFEKDTPGKCNVKQNFIGQYFQIEEGGYDKTDKQPPTMSEKWIYYFTQNVERGIIDKLNNILEYSFNLIIANNLKLKHDSLIMNIVILILGLIWYSFIWFMLIVYIIKVRLQMSRWFKYTNETEKYCKDTVKLKTLLDNFTFENAKQYDWDLTMSNETPSGNKTDKGSPRKENDNKNGKTRKSLNNDTEEKKQSSKKSKEAEEWYLIQKEKLKIQFKSVSTPIIFKFSILFTSLCFVIFASLQIGNIIYNNQIYYSVYLSCKIGINYLLLIPRLGQLLNYVITAMLINRVRFIKVDRSWYNKYSMINHYKIYLDVFTNSIFESFEDSKFSLIYYEIFAIKENINLFNSDYQNKKLFLKNTLEHDKMLSEGNNLCWYSSYYEEALKSETSSQGTNAIEFNEFYTSISDYVYECRTVANGISLKGLPFVYDFILQTISDWWADFIRIPDEERDLAKFLGDEVLVSFDDVLHFVLKKVNRLHIFYVEHDVVDWFSYWETVEVEFLLVGIIFNIMVVLIVEFGFVVHIKQYFRYMDRLILK